MSWILYAIYEILFGLADRRRFNNIFRCTFIEMGVIIVSKIIEYKSKMSVAVERQGPSVDIKRMLQAA